jgi:hypothetical protein
MTQVLAGDWAADREDKMGHETNVQRKGPRYSGLERPSLLMAHAHAPLAVSMHNLRRVPFGHSSVACMFARFARRSSNPLPLPSIRV